ncbi:hypothetical protein DUI87_01567 [Hirundo rustica rustica]|uniref:Uncharacterized protein n=1 Tax=Hirundo rustica rustica TaxID=333673 RepID=A0A3M0L5P2_HIRRU|nr:hypothetical protein DUI87_01567 [Hirundo rustica rustica]
MDSISQVIHDCEMCAAIKQAKRVKPLWYGGRWSKYKYGEAWQIDYITLPQTRQGKRYVLTMVEATTGWLETYPVPHATARNTILGLEKQVLWRHGTPERIESDNGTHFKNSLINTWAREHGIEWVYHIPYHAPAAGKVERHNALLKTQLKALGGGSFKNWEQNLAKATWLVNTRGSTNRAGPAQAEPLHTIDGDKVPVVHARGLLGKTVWIKSASSSDKPIRGVVFAQGPGCTWWIMQKDGTTRCVPQGDLIVGKIQMESDTYFSVYCTHKSKRCSTEPPACTEKSYQIYVCIEQQEKFTEPETHPVQGYSAILAYTVIEEARSITSKEPVVKLKIGPKRKELDFLVDLGAEKSTFKQLPPGCKISKDSMMVIGAKGEPFKVPIVKDVEIESENKICLGDMLLVEEADYNLLGRDLMVALGINLIVKDSKLIVSLYKLTLEDEREINPKVWHTGREAGRLEIERPEDPIRVKQYPISLEGRRGLKPIIEDLIAKGILEPCMSRHNTPILAIRKMDGSYRLVQDLRAVNERTKTRFPVVANPYTLLNRVSPEDICEKVKFLYEKLTTDKLKWTEQDERELRHLKEALIAAPVLSLPDVKKKFQLFIDVSNHTAHGVLTQDWAGDKKPVGYISKLLDPVSRGWPTILQAIVAVALLVEEAKKLTFGALLVVYTPHSVRTVLQQKADKWLTDARLLKYEAILIHAPELELMTTTAKNPAKFVFGDASEGLTHNCAEMIELQTKIRADLEEDELEEGEKWFVDGSARVLEGKRRSGYAVIDGKTGKVVESGPLSASWSAQACELYAVLQALKGLKGKAGTIYTDSKYAFGVVHTFGKIWEERGLINTWGKSLVHENLIKQILEAIREPKAITVVYVKGHQLGMQFRTRGNNLADQEAKRAALLTLNAPETQEGETQEFPPCPSEKEIEEFKMIGGILEDGKWKLPDGSELIPKDYARKILKRLHLQTHWGTQALAEQFLKFFGCKGIYELAKQEVQGCMTCQRINRSRTRQVSPGGRPLAYRPFGRIQVDFTELPKIGKHRYLLVIVDQLTHWVEAFPSPRATTQVVAKKLLEEIIPRYGIADSIDSDQGTHFTSKIIKHLANALGIRWEYHTPWHPQSSGQRDRITSFRKSAVKREKPLIQHPIDSQLSISEIPHAQALVDERCMNLSEKEVMDLFEKMMEDMNLNEERKAPLRDKDLSTKREMVIQYISATAKSSSEKGTLGFTG